jgi:hypothetical protein
VNKIRAPLHVQNYVHDRTLSSYVSERTIYTRADGSHYIIVTTNRRPYRETVRPHPDHPGEFLLERRSVRLVQAQRLPEILDYLRDKKDKSAEDA